MSRFSTYAKRADEIAKAAFKDYKVAETRYHQAEEKMKEYPQRFGVVNAEYAVKSTRAQADYLEAKDMLKTAKRVFEGHKSELATIRKELIAEINDVYSADPAQVDGKTLELLKSGIMNSSEYIKLLNEAQSNGNHTMARLIGKYAEDAIAAVSEKYGQNDKRVQELRYVAYQGNVNSGGEYLKAYDFIVDVYNRAVNNPGMIEHWDELTGQTIANF